jgi:hypothetical protein
MKRKATNQNTAIARVQQPGGRFQNGMHHRRVIVICQSMGGSSPPLEDMVAISSRSSRSSTAIAAVHVVRNIVGEEIPLNFFNMDKKV